MGLLKNVSRKLVFPLALGLRADKLLLRSNNHSCCIVNFHGVRKHDTQLFNNRHLPEAEFEKLIVYLKKNFQVVSLQEIFELHRRKTKPAKKTIALTFDDGYKNNFDVALPILKKHQVPATFYVIARCLEDQNYLAWPDMVDLLIKYHNEELVLDGHVFKRPGFYADALGMYLSDYLKTMGIKAEEKAELLLKGTDYRNRALQQHPELFKLIGAEDLRKYKDEALLHIGSHSYCHPNMEFLTAADADTELQKSANMLQDVLGKKVDSFAFPDGSYKPETVTLAKQAGYDHVVAVNYRHHEANTNPDILARFTISNSTTFESNALRLAREFDRFGFN